MRIATLIALFVASGYAATAQKLTILPQAGIENPSTKISYNGGTFFSPLCANLSPRLGVRMDYTLKSGHGAFVGVSTNRSLVSYKFFDPEAGRNMYDVAAGNIRLSFEGGYQFSTKPIYFGKAGAAKKSTSVQTSTNSVKRGCYGYCKGRSSKTSTDAKSVATRNKNKGWYMSIKPSAGFAFLPANNNDVYVPAQATMVNYQYKYQAGNWTSALVAGSGFEFGKNSNRMFTLSVNYLKGIGNLGERTFTSTVGSKTSTAILQSKVSAWSITAGIPITLYKKQSVTKVHSAPAQKNRTESRCGQYYRTKSVRL